MDIPENNPTRWLAFCAALVLGLQVACADFRPDAFALSRDITLLDGSGDTENMSGITLVPERDEMMVIQNRTAGGWPAIRVYDLDGGFKRSIPLVNFNDTEGFCTFNAASNRYAILEEARNTISVVTITSNTTSITRSTPYASMGLGNLLNKGMEGVVYDADSNCFYTVREDPQDVYRVSVTTNGQTDVELLFRATNLVDVSDIEFDPESRHLLLLSDLSHEVAEYDLDGNRLFRVTVPSYQPEGIYRAPDSRRLHIVGEPNQYLELSRREPDAFTWNGVPSPQYPNESFAVTVTAVDTNGAPFAPFTNTVALSARSLDLSAERTFPTNAVHTGTTSGVTTRGLRFTPSRDLHVTHVRHYWGTRISIWEDDGTHLATRYVESTPGVWLETALADPVTLKGGETYRVSGYTADTGGPHAWTTDPMPRAFADGTIESGCSGSGDRFPSTIVSGNLYLVGLRYQAGTVAPVAIDPVQTGPFVAGVWTGQVMVLQAASNVALRAEDDLAHRGDSTLFDVPTAPSLRIFGPEAAQEGDGLQSDALALVLGRAPVSNLVVSLQSSDPSELTVTNALMLSAGQTNAVLSYTVIDDGLLDGTQPADLLVTAPGYTDGRHRVEVYDNETAVLTLDLTNEVVEGAGLLPGAGRVFVDTPPGDTVAVSLASSDPASLSVPPYAYVPSGQVSVAFAVAVLDNSVIQDVRAVTVTAAVTNWTPDAVPVLIEDNEARQLFLSLPSPLLEGSGVLPAAGVVSLAGSVTNDLTVALSSDRTNELAVPVEVTIPAGAASNTFAVTLPEDALMDGDQEVHVSAAAPGFGGATAAVTVVDNNVRIEGRKWNDADGSGTWETNEQALAGWEIFVDRDGDGERDPGEPFGVTGVDGRYTIDSEAGTQTVAEVVRSGWQQTWPLVDPDDGRLSLVQEIRDQPPSDKLTTAARVAISPEGSNAYAVAEFDRAITTFARNPDSGELTFLQAIGDDADSLNSLNRVKAVKVSPDGRHIYTAARGDHAVTAFARGANGTLTVLQVFRDGTAPTLDLRSANDVLISPDGSNVYATAGLDDAVTVFRRDADSGLMTYVNRMKEGVGGVSGINSPEALAIDPDGHHVYVASDDSHGVAVFARDAGTGTLTFVEAILNGVDGITGLQDCHGVTVSPDGRQVYVAARDGRTLSVFARHPLTGRLTLRQSLTDGGGIDGLNGAQDVVVSPDGRSVYVSGNYDDAIAVFRRDLSTGLLELRQVVDDGVGGVTRLNGVRGLTVSPDGKHLYAAAEADHSISVFARDVQTPARGHRLVLGPKQTISGIDFGNRPAPLWVSVPDSAQEGAGLVSGGGLIETHDPAASNVWISLSSDDASELSVSNGVTLASGMRYALFDLALPEDGELDGSQVVRVTAASAVHTTGSGDTTVHDNESTLLTVTLPTPVREGDGVRVGEGAVATQAPVDADVRVSIALDDLTEIAVPGVVTVAVGTATGRFDVTVLEDALIDGLQQVTVTAQVENWSNGVAVVDVVDADTNLLITLPTVVLEGDGLIAPAGEVQIVSPLTNDLRVELASDLPGELQPGAAEIFIGQGTTSAPYTLSVQDDAARDGSTFPTIRATATGFGSDSGVVEVADNERVLTVLSEYGLTTPAPGVYTNVLGSFVASTVIGLVSMTTSQYMASGWSVTGQTDIFGMASGAPSNVFLVVSNDAILTWHWGVQYWLSTSNSGPGTVDPPSGWQFGETPLTARGIPDRYYAFSQWSGPGTGAISSGTVDNAEIQLNLTGPASLTASFGDAFATNGVPVLWLVSHGLTNAAWDVEALSDPDSDGMLTWGEFVSDTDPTNAGSVLAVRHFRATNGEATVHWQGGRDARQYVQRAARLLPPGGWFTIQTNEPPTPVTNMLQETGITNPVFYRIKAEQL